MNIIMSVVCGHVVGCSVADSTILALAICNDEISNTSTVIYWAAHSGDSPNMQATQLMSVDMLPISSLP